MAVEELVIREPYGLSPDGSQRYYTTYTGRPKPPETVAEWAEIRAAMVSDRRAMPACRIALALLDAAVSGEDTGAALGAARQELGDWGRWGLLQLLEEWRTIARDGYPPAAVLMDRLVREWTARYGSRKPKPQRLPREARMGLA